MPPDYIKIDGSMGEGGGSVLRVASGISCALGCPIEVKNIRANRKTPGLRLQHKLGLETLRDLTSGTLSEVDVGSTKIKFSPGEQWKNSLDVRVGTAANVALLCQGIQIALFQAPGNSYKINFNGGGTYGKWAPGTAFLQNVTYNLFNLMGYKADIAVRKHGFYPKGGAQSTLTVTPDAENYSGLVLTKRGDLQSVEGLIVVESRLKKPKVA